MIKQIYTKTGDDGTTSLRDGVRVKKDDIRIETNGQIDHLNSMLGVVRSTLNAATYAASVNLIKTVQQELMVVMSHIATPEGHVNPRQSHAEEITAELERAIDELTKDRKMGFVLPGNNPNTMFVHVARTQCRTVERRLWQLNRTRTVDSSVLRMFNRLSDFLFALAEH